MVVGNCNRRSEDLINVSNRMTGDKVVLTTVADQNSLGDQSVRFAPVVTLTCSERDTRSP